MEVKKLKPDRRLEDMEALHKSTNTRGNLNLKEGQRLKVENKFKPKPPKALPNFDIHLADIGDAHLASSVFLDRNSDDEILPDPSEITKAPKQVPSSDHSFSNPEMDDLIRDMPIEVADPSRRSEASIPRSAPSSQSLTSLMNQKRTETKQKSERPAKRLKTSHLDGSKTASTPPLATLNRSIVRINAPQYVGMGLLL